MSIYFGVSSYKVSLCRGYKKLCSYMFENKIKSQTIFIDKSVLHEYEQQ